MNNETEIKSAKHALRESMELPAIWSHESRLTQRTLIYVASVMEKQNLLLEKLIRKTPRQK